MSYMNAYMNALDTSNGWTVVYITLNGDNWGGASDSWWIVPGTLED